LLPNRTRGLKVNERLVGGHPERSEGSCPRHILRCAPNDRLKYLALSSALAAWFIYRQNGDVPFLAAWAAHILGRWRPPNVLLDQSP
jgi:hypothetical protein